jgi:hypothetical protein
MSRAFKALRSKTRSYAQAVGRADVHFSLIIPRVSLRFTLGYALVAPTTTPSRAKPKTARAGEPRYGAFDDGSADSSKM